MESHGNQKRGTCAAHIMAAWDGPSVCAGCRVCSFPDNPCTVCLAYSPALKERAIKAQSVRVRRKNQRAASASSVSGSSLHDTPGPRDQDDNGHIGSPGPASSGQAVSANVSSLAAKPRADATGNSPAEASVSARKGRKTDKRSAPSSAGAGPKRSQVEAPSSDAGTLPKAPVGAKRRKRTSDMQSHVDDSGSSDLAMPVLVGPGVRCASPIPKGRDEALFLQRKANRRRSRSPLGILRDRSSSSDRAEPTHREWAVSDEDEEVRTGVCRSGKAGNWFTGPERSQGTDPGLKPVSGTAQSDWDSHRSSTDRYTLPDRFAGPDRSSVPDQYRPTGPDRSAGPDQYRSTGPDRSAGPDRYWRVAPDRAGTLEPRRERSLEPGRGREAGPERSRHAKVDRRRRSRLDHQGYSERSRKGGRRRFRLSSSASSSSEYSESDATYEPSRGRQGGRGLHGRCQPRHAVENSGTAQILKALTGITNRLTALEAGHVHSPPAPNREEEE